MKFWFALILILTVAVSGCSVSSNNSQSAEAANLCQRSCLDMISTSIDMSTGPCLNNNIIQDWVCDIAHNPREPVDEQPQNQCPAYGTSAHHFVEVDENCRIIRVV